MGIALFFVGEGPRPDGQFLVFGGRKGGGVRALVKMVCALFSSTWQCRKARKQGSNSYDVLKKILHLICLTAYCVVMRRAGAQLSIFAEPCRQVRVTQLVRAQT